MSLNTERTQRGLVSEEKKKDMPAEVAAEELHTTLQNLQGGTSVSSAS